MLHDEITAASQIANRVIPPPTLIEATAPVPPTANPEQLRAIDDAFTQPRENDAVAGLVHCYFGALILKDMATEHFSRPTNEEPIAKDKDKNEEDEEPDQS